MATSLIRDISDIGSTVALTLVKAGHDVELIDGLQPPYFRRAASLVDRFINMEAGKDQAG